MGRLSLRTRSNTHTVEGIVSLTNELDNARRGTGIQRHVLPGIHHPPLSGLVMGLAQRRDLREPPHRGPVGITHAARRYGEEIIWSRRLVHPPSVVMSGSGGAWCPFSA